MNDLLSNNEFKSYSVLKKFRTLNEMILKFIEEAPHESFLMPEIIGFIDRINQENFFKDTYSLNHFEFFLTNFSGLSVEKRALIRGKITGKYIPREEFQRFFPIGMGKQFRGSHIVTAHLSPDLDTTVASFVSWMEAFACEVCDKQHIWNLPGGPPESPVIAIFKEMYGDNVFQALARYDQALFLTASDVLTQEGFIRDNGKTSVSTLDHGAKDKAITLVDQKGYYRGDWRSGDVEKVRQVTILYKAALKWFENNFLITLVQLFGQNKPIETFFQEAFDIPVYRSQVVVEFGDREKESLEILLKKVIGLNGLDVTFRELIEKLQEHNVDGLKDFMESVKLNVTKNSLKLSREEIFKLMESLLKSLNNAMYHAREWIEQLSVALAIKNEVLGSKPHVITYKSQIEEIELKMKDYDHLTVVVPEENEFRPIGIVRAKDLRDRPLGTVSFRDFGNLEEVKLPSYFSIISVIDHHKSSFTTQEPPLAVIGDAQSCNVIICELTFAMNDRYSSRGKDSGRIQKEINGQKDPEILSRLYRQQTALTTKREHFIHPKRELYDCILCLHAILDDTDLLTKVSARDVYCVQSLLNRIRALKGGNEADVVSFEKDQPQKAARQILESEEMHEIYRKTIDLKLEEVEKQIALFVKKAPHALFSDMKEQNHSSRVGQIKLFQKNFISFDKISSKLRLVWLNLSYDYHVKHPDIDIYILMVSTLPDTTALNKDLGSHQDEMWIWVPETDKALSRLASFLHLFSLSGHAKSLHFEVEIFNDKDLNIESVFVKNFLPSPILRSRDELKYAYAILRFKPGSLNSRKSMISPYLPK